jgi:hypothetical protein
MRSILSITRYLKLTNCGKSTEESRTNTLQKEMWFRKKVQTTNDIENWHLKRTESVLRKQKEVNTRSKTIFQIEDRINYSQHSRRDKTISQVKTALS